MNSVLAKVGFLGSEGAEAGEAEAGAEGRAGGAEAGAEGRAGGAEAGAEGRAGGADGLTGTEREGTGAAAGLAPSGGSVLRATSPGLAPSAGLPKRTGMGSGGGAAMPKMVLLGLAFAGPASTGLPVAGQVRVSGLCCLPQ